jgi:hypothetical protein
MPVIPRGQENVRMEAKAPVAIGSTSDARIAGESISAAGQGLQRLGEGFMAEQQKQEDFDRGLKVQESVNQLQNAYKLGMEHADRNSAPDGSDYGAKMQEAAGPMVQEAMKAVQGDQKAMSQVGSYYNRMKNDAETSAAIVSVRMREANNYKRQESLFDASADRVRENPKEEMVGAEFKQQTAQLNELVAKGVFTPDKAAKLQGVYAEKVAAQFINGLETKEQYGKALSFLKANEEDPNNKTMIDPDMAANLGLVDRDQAKALKDSGEKFGLGNLTKGDKVKLSPEMNAIFRSLDPRSKAQLIDSMQAKLKARTEMRLADLHSQVTGFESVALNGGQYTDKDVAAVKQQINQNPYVNETARRRLMDKVNTADALNKQSQLLTNTPRSEWGNVLDGVNEKINLSQGDAAKFDKRMGDVHQDFAVQANRMEAIQRFERTMSNVQKMQEADAAAFVQQTDPRVQNLYRGSLDDSPEGHQAFQQYLTASVAKQNYLGIPADKQRITTKSESAQIAGALSSLQDAGAINDTIAGLQNKYGSYFPKVMQEVAKTDKSLADFTVIGFADPSTREKLVDALKNEKAVQNTIKSSDIMTTRSKSVKSEVDAQMTSFRTALTGSSDNSQGLQTSNSISKLVALQANREIARGSNEPVHDLVKRAYDDVVGNFDIVDAPRSSILVPKVVAGRQMDSKILGTYMKVYSTADNLPDLNIKVPATYSKPEDFYNQLGRVGKWETNETQTGIMLVMPNPSGRGMQAVLDKYGKPVEKTFEEINLKPGQKVIEANKSIVQKLFGG